MSPARLVRRLVVVAVTLAGLAASAVDAPAQGGPGAERYEVTITPPKRPGTENAGEASTPAPADGGPGTAGPGAAPAAAAKVASSPDNVLGGSEAASATKPPPAPAPANAPLRTLQVGAFRQQASAEALRDQLASGFGDVAIVEVASGGEPLYRVNVGRLPKGPELTALKKRLADAGFPAFDVPLPKTASSR